MKNDDKASANQKRTEPSSWPVLSAGTAGRIGVEGDLHVDGGLSVSERIQGELASGSVSSRELAPNAVTSARIAEADRSTGQNTNTGRGIKTGHIQNNAITEEKLAPAVRDKLAGLPSAGGRRSIVPLVFTEADADGTTKTVTLGFQPQYLLSNGAITSPFDNNVLPHGGVTSGFAELAEASISQFAVGTVAHVGVRPPNEVFYQRTSGITPETLVDTDITDRHGIAIGLLQYNDEKELILIRVKAVVNQSITFELRRGRGTPGPPGQLQYFRAEVYAVCFG
ncbi:MAG: hypothetical protein GY856_05940 [bacterium]|nr:hypothetical protein [bacterium]